MEYLTLAAAATLLFLMGFSALGPVLIFLFTMFYGLGNGTLFVQLLSDTALKRGNVASVACISACGSCFCRAVHARHRFSAGEQPDPRLFLFCTQGSCTGHDRIRLTCDSSVQYLLTLIVMFVPLCGISAALASYWKSGFDQGASEDAFLAGLLVICYNRE